MVEATVRRALAMGVASLHSASRDPRRDAELLLMHLLECDLAALLTHPERSLSPLETARYDAMLRRRMAREPMQYITGAQEFFGLSIKVTPDVLIPRPETEHLVEAALKRVSRYPAPSIADVGTGSGAIAIALAYALPQARLTAVDLSVRALEVARENAQRHGVLERIRFLESDLLAAVGGESFDAVVANLPYVAEGEELEAEVRDYEPPSALYAGSSGLEAYARLVPEALGVLRPGGWLILEIGHGQKDPISRLLRDWGEINFVEDLQGIPRIAIARQVRPFDPS